MVNNNATSETFASPKSITKLARRVARIIRHAGLNYDQWRTLNKKVRHYARLKLAKRKQRLPNILTAEQLKAFYDAVDASSNLQHSILTRMLFFTGCRVSELCNLTTEDVCLTNCRVRVNSGKGDKDRFTLFPQSFALTLKAYMAGLKAEVLFPSRQGGPLTPRRVEQIIGVYAQAAGVKATPHTFRHQCLTALTAAGMTDSQIQLISGHAFKSTLAIYQHIGLTPEIQETYNATMKV